MGGWTGAQPGGGPAAVGVARSSYRANTRRGLLRGDTHREILRTWGRRSIHVAARRCAAPRNVVDASPVAQPGSQLRLVQRIWAVECLTLSEPVPTTWARTRETVMRRVRRHDAHVEAFLGEGGVLVVARPQSRASSTRGACRDDERNDVADEAVALRSRSGSSGKRGVSARLPLGRLRRCRVLQLPAVIRRDLARHIEHPRPTDRNPVEHPQPPRREPFM